MNNSSNKKGVQGFGPIKKAGQENANLEGSILTLGKMAVDLKVIGSSGEIDEGLKIYGINSFLDKSDFPHKQESDSGSIRLMGTRENLEHLMASYNISCKYNKISKATEIDIKGQEYTVDNAVNALLSELSSICVRNQLPKTLPQDYVLTVADASAYNPILEWITSKVWDGVDRISSIVDTVIVPEDYNQLKNVYIRKWLMCAVAMLHNEGLLDYEGVLVFQGEQGSGKTKWLKSLLPESLERYIEDGALIEPRNKDTILTACAHWLVEMGELDSTFKASDISDIKRFITKKADKLRRPYAREDSYLPRRTVFFGSVNERTFLKDKTGNRRFWVLPTIDFLPIEGLNLQQIWAQVLHDLNEAGGCRSKNSPWYLNKEDQKLRDKGNEAFTEVTATEEMILDRFTDKKPYIRASATNVADMIGISNITTKDTREIGAILKKHFDEPTMSRGINKYKLPFPNGLKEQTVFVHMNVTRCRT